MDGLGRVFNVLPVANGVYVSLKLARGVAFVGTNVAGDTWTLTEARDAAGTGAQVLATIDRYYVSATVGSVWQQLAQAAGSAVVSSAAQDVVVIPVFGQELSDGYTHVKLTATGAGTVVALQHDLTVQRKPANLPALV